MKIRHVFPALIAGMPLFCGPSGVTLYGPSLSKARDSIVVSIGAPRPPFDAVAKIGVWQVVAKPQGASIGAFVQVASVTVADPDPNFSYLVTGQVRLLFTAPLSDWPDSVEVILTMDKPVSATWKKKKDPQQQGAFGDPVGFYPAKKEKADVYLFGSIASGVGSNPSYNVDMSVATPSLLLGRKPLKNTRDNRKYLLSITGTAKTADQPKLDPDSFSAAVTVGRRYPKSLDSSGRSYLNFQWDAAKWEFSRKDQAFNFISAPTVIYNFGKDLVTEPARIIKASTSFDFFAGLEAGENLRNKIARDGYGGIVRVVPGAAFYFILPGTLGMKQIAFTSDYHTRILLEKEPFIDTRGATRTYLARGSRHTLAETLTLKLNDYFSIQAKHEYGSLPPAFKFVDHKITVGLTTMWMWRK